MHLREGEGEGELDLVHLPVEVHTEELDEVIPVLNQKGRAGRESRAGKDLRSEVAWPSR